MYKQDLAFNNPQGLISQPNKHEKKTTVMTEPSSYDGPEVRLVLVPKHHYH